MGASRVVRLKVQFQDRLAAASCLQDLSQIPGTSVNVIRGRVTPKEAHYDLELRGEGRVLERAVWTLWSVTTLSSRAQAELQEA
jgi:hypothetical protein